MHNGLNGAQTRALAKLKAASNVEFQRLTARDKRPPKSKMGHVSKDSCQTNLKEMSGREIDIIADRAVDNGCVIYPAGFFDPVRIFNRTGKVPDPNSALKMTVPYRSRIETTGDLNAAPVASSTSLGR